MCLILLKDPKVELPYEGFITAVANNPDGYGLSYVEDGKLKVTRDFKKPDPDKLYRFISEDLDDVKVMAHLRYTTAGKTILKNAHPFPILERNKDGVDLRMCHNGTIFKYKPSGNTSVESDTRKFVKEYVRPLFKRLVKGISPEELLNDSFVKYLLEDQISNSSVLTFMDSDNNTLICNETGNGGGFQNGIYFSNKYSFNANHRKPSYEKKSVPPALPNSTKTGGSNKATGNSFGGVEKFTDKFGIEDVKDLLSFSDNTIKQICLTGNNTLNAELLIKELLHEVHTLRRVCARLQKEAKKCQ